MDVLLGIATVLCYISFIVMMIGALISIPGLSKHRMARLGWKNWTEKDVVDSKKRLIIYAIGFVFTVLAYFFLIPFIRNS